jgi:hypothetical protein
MNTEKSKYNLNNALHVLHFPRCLIASCLYAFMPFCLFALLPRCLVAFFSTAHNKRPFRASVASAYR